jgi:uncharacterized membrane protein YphA (DoxX/SURF4 family)
MQSLTKTEILKAWTLPEKVLFRFFALFFGITIFPFPLYVIPVLGDVLSFIDKAMNWLVVFTGKHILHLSYDITVQPNGSGDTTWNYVQLFIITVLALIGCIIWSIADRRKKNYNRWLYWLLVGVRYYLAYSLIAYGSFKIFKTQFPAPSIGRLTETYGQSSPMGLAWTFLGFSKAYNYFMGIAEAGGGLLLLFRRTAIFGVLLSMIVSANIVAINFCFDVPVKLYSSTLLLMSLFILAPEVSRLYRFFFQRKTISLKAHAFTFQTRWKRITAYIIKSAFILYILITYTRQGISDLKLYGDDAPKPKLYGYYNINTFVKNTDTLPPLLTDTTRWNKLVFGYYDRVSVKMMNDTLISFTYVDDTLHHQLTLTGRSDTALKYLLNYRTLPADTLELTSNEINLYMKLNKINAKDFLLVNRGFRWINEYPLNR